LFCDSVASGITIEPERVDDDADDAKIVFRFLLPPPSEIEVRLVFKYPAEEDLEYLKIYLAAYSKSP